MIDAGATQADPARPTARRSWTSSSRARSACRSAFPPTVGQIEENNPDLDYSIVPIPTQDSSPFTLGVMDQLMAFQNDGDKQDAITKFLDYYYTSDVYVPWVQAEGFLPVTKSAPRRSVARRRSRRSSRCCPTRSSTRTPTRSGRRRMPRSRRSSASSRRSRRRRS